MEVTKKTTEPVVFDFLDYRDYLKALYETRRETSSVFSYRFMAQRIDVDAGQLARILQGKLHLPQRALSATLKLCKLDGREAAYFEDLFRLGKAKDPEEAARCRERLEALKVPPPRIVGSEQAEYYRNWRHSVVRAIATLDSIPQEPETIANSCRPPIGPEQAKESLALLLQLGLLMRTSDGRLQPSDPHLSANENLPLELLRGWHAQAMEQGRRALAEIPPTERDVSTMTLALSAADLPTIRAWVVDLRRQVRALAASTTNSDRVFQVNVQFFPVATRAKSRKPGQSRTSD